MEGDKDGSVEDWSDFFMVDNMKETLSRADFLKRVIHSDRLRICGPTSARAKRHPKVNEFVL
mgnify:CR=1 FL=1